MPTDEGVPSASMICAMMDAMDITSRAEYAADPETVFSMLTNPDYLHQVCVASQALEHEVSVEGSRTRTSRTLAAPESAARFTGPRLTVVEETDWREATGIGRVGSVQLTVTGQPVSMRGEVQLSAGGPGSIVTMTGELKVAVPLLGKKLEKSAAPGVLLGFETQERVGKTWLGG